MLLLRNPNLLLTYPLSANLENDLSDYTYLEELYPVTIKIYQLKVKEAVDELDYPGSMIYDEYPDALSLYRVADRIAKDIELNKALSSRIHEEMERAGGENPSLYKGESRLEQEPGVEFSWKKQNEFAKEKGPYELVELIQVLLCMEIHKRRCKYQKDCYRVYVPSEKNAYQAPDKNTYLTADKNQVEKIEKRIYNKE